MAAPLFFANGAVFGDAVRAERVRASEGVRHVVIDMEAVTDVDVTGAEAFERAAHVAGRKLGSRSSFSRVRDRRPPNGSSSSACSTDEQVFDTNREAVRRADTGGTTINVVIGEILPLALGIAVSPIPIIAAILMLLSPRAKGTSVGFLLGWVVGIVVAVTVFTCSRRCCRGAMTTAPTPRRAGSRSDSASCSC